ncbi:ATP-binding cassette domain-containing protein [Lysobacter korlensis]|uniref:ATP-binding cassette domain-containing protein n=1 Tax=Lysobacter korlensis TaxID=553636 RepID=A0ABV6RMI8_9GAMM
MTDQELAILADDLCAHYPGERRGARGLALNGVSFRLRPGEILGVVGEAGSGKSTLARTIAGLSGLPIHGSPRISGGSLQVLGLEVRGMRSKARDRLALRVGYLPQDAGALLDPHLTVGENVSAPIFARDKHFSSRDAGELVATLIDAVHLPLGILTKYPHELSRGQRQRVALARALILEPALLIADDPTMGVDLLVRGAILDVIGELRSTREFSALIIAHEVGELRRITDRVMVMHQGMTVALGTIDGVLADPRHPYVQRLAVEYRIEHPQQRLAGRARDLALRARLVE